MVNCKDTDARCTVSGDFDGDGRGTISVAMDVAAVIDLNLYIREQLLTKSGCSNKYWQAKQTEVITTPDFGKFSAGLEQAKSDERKLIRKLSGYEK